MIRRSIQLIAMLLICGLLAAGCGSKGGSSSGGLETALSYVPKGAPLVIAVDTDAKGPQYSQLKKLIGKFPGGGQIQSSFESGFNSSSAGIDFEKDFKPLLGNDLVLAIQSQSNAATGSPTRYVLAWKVGDEGAAKRLVTAKATKAGSAEGVDVYRKNSSTSTFYAYKDGAIVGAESVAGVAAALKRAGGGDHMTVDDFSSALGDLDQDGLVRVAANVQSLIGTNPQALAARKVKWIGALRKFGAALSAKPDGIDLGFQATTEGALGSADLPLASGARSAPVVRRAGEIGVGVRNPAQVVRYGEVVSQLTDPKGFARFVRQKRKVGKQLGIDVERDLIGQLTGNSAISVTLDGSFALRADVRDPAAAEATLKKAAPRLEKLAKGKSLGLSTPKGGQGFYALAQANGKKVVFGIVGKSFVAATDAGRAAQFAGQSPSIVPGARGAAVVASDARALANALAAKRGQGAAAQVVTGALGDLVGSIEAETSCLKGNFKLQIK